EIQARLEHFAGEPIESAAHVDGLGGQEDPLGVPGGQHEPSSLTSAASQAAGGGSAKASACGPIWTVNASEVGVTSTNAALGMPLFGSGGCRAIQVRNVPGRTLCARAKAAADRSEALHCMTSWRCRAGGVCRPT